ncbi:hypothetical protein HanXRQr2_Chr14g0640871 [Helianthus annuus]|uniref:Uncharacterized protein n=1 Tax=Helianthus annuus TaxID=4232 RepID=A0A9K3H7F2_HELAN|nr:hypothetical protein HanXRQr2_Chr14g0640871 [Helianthus annuus]
MGWRNLMFRVAHKMLDEMLEQENITKLIGIKKLLSCSFKKNHIKSLEQPVRLSLICSERY